MIQDVVMADKIDVADFDSADEVILRLAIAESFIF